MRGMKVSLAGGVLIAALVAFILTLPSYVALVRAGIVDLGSRAFEAFLFSLTIIIVAIEVFFVGWISGRRGIR